MTEEAYEEVYIQDMDGNQIYEEDGVTPVKFSLSQGQYQTLWVKAQEEGKELEEVIVDSIKDFIADLQDKVDD